MDGRQIGTLVGANSLRPGKVPLVVHAEVVAAQGVLGEGVVGRAGPRRVRAGLGSGHTYVR